jgi:hypothetical protein
MKIGLNQATLEKTATRQFLRVRREIDGTSLANKTYLLCVCNGAYYQLDGLLYFLSDAGRYGSKCYNRIRDMKEHIREIMEYHEDS